MRKRILSVILLVCMLVNNLPVAALAEESTSGCSHVCDSSCGYVAAVDCDKGCAPAEEGAELVHKEGCAFNAGSPCTHQHNGDCGVACTHNYVEGVCAICGDNEPQPQPCEHIGGTATCEAQAVCDTCGKGYGDLADHTYSQGTCSVCGEVCEHSYNTEGTCSVCGMAKPQPVCDCEVRCAETGNASCDFCGIDGADLTQCIGKEPKVECDCESKCTAENKNSDCPVCKAEDADLINCIGKEPETEAPVITVSKWEWVKNEDGVSIAQEEDGTYVTDLPLVGNLETVISVLPGYIQIGDTQVEITWKCEGFSEAAGTYIFTAILPEGYELAEDAAALTLKVNMGVAEVLNHTCSCGEFATALTESMQTLETGNYYLNSGVGDLSDKKTLTINGDVELCLSNKLIRNYTIIINRNCSLTLYDCGAGYFSSLGYITINEGATFNLYSGKLYGGNVRIGSGGTFNMYGGIIEVRTSGYGVECNGTFKMVDGGIECTTTNSHGVYIGENGSFTMTGGSISAKYVGVTVAHATSEFTLSGGNVTRGVENYGTFEMSGGSVTGSSQGGVRNLGSFTMSDGEIWNNTTSDSIGAGGVLNHSGGTFTMSGGKIHDNNNYYGTGGGVHNKGNFTMTGGSIYINKATSGGGVANDGTFTMSGGKIYGNTGSNGGGVANSPNCTVNLSGPVEIYGNKNGSYNNNVYGIITITGPLANTNPIGISYNTEFTTALKEPSQYVNQFTADDSKYYISVTANNTLQCSKYNNNQAPESLSLPEEITMVIGATRVLVPVVTPSDAGQEKNLKWSTSKYAVAAVSGGTVTAQAVGDAVITVKWNSNSTALTATCTVHVVTGYKFSIAENSIATITMADGTAEYPSGKVTFTAEPKTELAEDTVLIPTVTKTQKGTSVPVTAEGNNTYSFTMPEDDNVTISAVVKTKQPVQTLAPVNGDVSVSPEKAVAGDTVTVTPDADAGYRAKVPTVTDADGSPVEVSKVTGSDDYTFTMPEGGAKVDVSFAKVYPLTAPNCENGIVTITPAEAIAEEKVTIKAAPTTDDYKVKEITVTAADGSPVAVSNDSGSNQYTFTMPEGGATVDVSFKPVATGFTLSENGTEPLAITTAHTGLKLTPVFTPADASEDITWISSDSSVLEVDDKGTLTPKGIGVATITATVAGFAPVTRQVKVQEGHIHCVCGSTTCSGAGHNPYQEWTAAVYTPAGDGYAISFNGEGCYYYLDDSFDWEDSTWYGKACICTNGHYDNQERLFRPNGTFTLTSCTPSELNWYANLNEGCKLNLYEVSLLGNEGISSGTSGSSINMYSGTTPICQVSGTSTGNGSVHLYGGSITSTVYLNNNGIFTMSGGTVSNVELYCTNLNRPFTFNLEGGEVTGTVKYNINSGNDRYGTINISGGSVKEMYLKENTTLNISGGSITKLNLAQGVTFIVNGTLTGSDRIGITTATVPDGDDRVKIATSNVDNSDYFYSNVAGYDIAFDNGALYLQVANPVTSVKLNAETLLLGVGQEMTLTATVNPAGADDPDVIWSSSNPAAATVDADGMVTAVAKGTADITARTKNGMQDTCTVTVEPLHSHAVGTSGDAVAWTPWDGTGTMPTGNVYLTKSVELAGSLCITQNTCLCLNGVDITSPYSSAILIQSSATFTLCDCKQTGNISTDHMNGDAVTVESGGTFIQYGGTIQSSKGSGVYNEGTFQMHGGTIQNSKYGDWPYGVHQNGDFHMTGGTVTGNTYGVYVSAGKTFNVSGSPSITGNTQANVYLAGVFGQQAKIRIPAQLNSVISLSMESPGTFFVYNGEEETFPYATTDKFESHSGDYKVSMFTSSYSNSYYTSFFLEGKMDFTVNNENDSKGTVTATPKPAFAGDDVTVTVVPEEGWDVEKITVTVTVDDQEPFVVTEASDSTCTFQMPDTGGEVAVKVTYKEVIVITQAPEAASDLVYTGAAQSLVTGGTAMSGTMPSLDIEYCVTNSNTAPDMDDSGWDTAIPEKKDAGTYYVWYKVIHGEAKPCGPKLAGTVTIGQVAPVVDKVPTAADSTGLVYDGQPKELITAGESVHGTFLYKLGGGEWSETIPTVADAGTYTVSWKLDGDTNHTGHDGGTITVTIGRLAIDKPKADTTEFIYDGSLKTYTVASSNGYTDTGYTVTGNTQTNAGQYKVTVQLNSNYKWSDGTTADLTFDFNIAQKAVAEPAVISTYTYTYTGAEQTVALNGFYSDYMEVSGNKGTNAGNYEAVVTLTNSNYKWADDHDGKIPWSIANATLTDVSVVQKDPLTFTGAAQIPTVTTAATAVGNQRVTFTYTTDVNGTYIANLPQFTYGGDYTVYYKATAANHNNATGSFTVTVGRKIVELPTVENKVYTGKPLTADLVDTALYAVTQGTDWTDIGSYNVTLTLKDTNNYTWEDSSEVETLVFKIIQATNEWTQTPTISGWTYGDNANAPVAKAKFGEVVVRYEGENYSSTAVPTAAGNYKAVFTVAGTANYTELTEVVVDFTISKDEIQLTAAPSAKNLFFDETEQELVRAGTCSQEGPVFYYAMTTVNSEPDADAYSTAIPKAKNAGTYYVWYYAAGENFHTTQIKCVEVTIHKQPVALPAPSDGTLSLVYGQTLDELQLTSYWRWANPDEKPTVENNGYLIYFDFPGDPANYDLAVHTDKWNEEKQRIESIWPVVVSKYQVAKPAVDATQFLYNGAEQTYTVAASDWYTVTGNTRTNAGTQYVQIALVDTANCEWADSTDADSATAALQYSFTVQPKPVTVTAKKQTIIYNNSIETTVDQAEATGLVAGHAMTEVVLTASTTDYPGGKITPSAAVIKNGNADVTGNYDITYADSQLIINKAEQTAPSLEKTDETIAAKNDGIISKVDGTMEYKLDGADAWTSVEEGKEKLTGLSDGTYLVRYKEKNNFNASPVTTVVIAPGRQLTVTTDPVKESQIGYSFTVDPAAVDYQGETQLTLVLNQEYNKLENQFRITHNGTDVTDKLTADNKLTLSGLTEDAEVKIQGIGDTVAPQVTITVAPSAINTFLRVITFGAVNKAQDVTITASDAGSGVQDISYYVASEELTDAEIAAITWKGYNGSFQLQDDGSYVVYAKVSDRTGNVTVVNSDGIILDTVAPTVTGVENGQTYYGDQTVTITDGVSVTVTLDGEIVTPEDGKVTIPANNAERTFSITDAAGNVAEYKITVYKIYTVTFVADGKTVTTQQVNHNANADMTVAIPRKAGYTDKAPIWSLDGATAADGKAITADTTFTAVYYKNDPGVYEDITSSGSNTAGVDVDNSIEELKAAVPMTEEELLLVEQGEDVKIWMVSVDASSSVPAEDKNLVRRALGGGAVGMYLDIDLFKQIGDNAPVQVTALKNKITVTLDVPSALINRDFNRTRTYYIVRVHEGEATVITPQFSSLRRTLTFETDRFSTYAIAYVDVAKPSAVTPYTGDSSHIGLWITVLGLSTTALVTLLVLNRKKSKSKK